MDRRRTSRIMGLLHAFNRGMHERIRKSSRRPSFPRIYALIHVRESGGTTAKDVAETLCVAPPTATVLLRGLIREGLLAKTTDPDDRRAIRLVVTPKGERALAQAFSTLESALADILAPLDEREGGQFEKILTKLSGRRPSSKHL